MDAEKKKTNPDVADVIVGADKAIIDSDASLCAKEDGNACAPDIEVAASTEGVVSAEVCGDGIAAESETFSFDELKPKIKPIYKVLFLCVLIICMIASIVLSFISVALPTYEYVDNGDGYTLSSLQNTGNMTNICVNWVMEERGSDWVVSDKPVTAIREYAFCCDEFVEYITIGANVRSIEDNAFYYCKGLKAIFVDEGNEYFSSDNGILYNHDKTKLILFPIKYCDYEGSKLVKESVGEGDAAVELMRYELPVTVTELGALCFNEVDNLGYVKLPDNLVSIGTMAFFKCDTLREISLPDGLTFIGSDSFSSCSALEYMFIPSSVTEIDHHAFYKCDGLKEICVALSEQDFEQNVKTGEHWRPQHFISGVKLFKESAPIVYNSERRG